MPLIHDRNSRGHTKTGWLDSFHTFSMGGFYDPKRVQHRALRVLNEDRVIPGAGFGKHDHQEMDIVTLVLSGALRHEDSLGNGSVIHPGEIQSMTAGTGITHSEMNASESEQVHFYQIWIIPDETGLSPSYQQRPIDLIATKNTLHPIACGRGSDGTVKLHSDTTLLMAGLTDGASVHYQFEPGRAGFLQVVSGLISIDGNQFKAGDGLQFESTGHCSVDAEEDATVLLFDLK
ncbi:pirin family protein [Parasedimentitalea marina]|uniref:Pirin family protein n=1 Tax=Parasedimentitalea marina TaxID=2483033 RepID=A0A3T0N795_9RHOB|nr:pirin family protein [Parasedimentitalea marina]AZV79898.1 pirin family protein [Parasedimentitalea marina]